MKLNVFALSTLFVLNLITLRASAQSLDGTWEITAVIDNGRVVDPTEVLMNYAAEGRVVIRGQQVEIRVPVTYERKVLPFIVDNAQSPMTFDLAGAEKTGGRGIFLAGKDTMMLCLSSRTQGRPATFASLPGSGNLLVTLKRSTGAASFPGQQSQPTYEDEQLRRMLVGTWGHQDNESIHYITLANDGTAKTVTTWKDQFKQLFHRDVNSSGRWEVKDRVVTVTIDQSSDPERRGQTGSFRVRSITGSELVAVDYDGEVRQEWKAPQ